MSRKKLKRKWVEIPEDCCVLCRLSDDHPDLLGEKIYLKEKKLTVHYLCLKGQEKDGVFGFLVKDIKKEVMRCSRLKCAVCRRMGASVGCCVTTCRKTVHFPCGQSRSSFIFQFTGEFMSYCIEHAPHQSVGGGEVCLPQSCSVCLDAIAPPLCYSVLKCPACHASWFHRDCIQRQARSAGLHFFRCSLCNNKEDFQEEMLTLGIYIPERDASWELESNAFEELLQVYENCDAPVCCCRHGRSYSGETGEEELSHPQGEEGVLEAGLELVRRPTFDPRRRLSVRFKDAHTAFPSCPGGSPAAARYFLKRLIQDIQNSQVFEGPDGNKNLALDSRALREDLYLSLGCLLSVCLVHGAPPPLFFSPALFQSAQSVEDLNEAMAASWEYLELAGCNRPISSLEERDALVEDLVGFTMTTRMQLPLQRFREGLKTLGVFEQMYFSVSGLQVQLHPAAFYRTFCGPENHPLSPRFLVPRVIAFNPPSTAQQREESEVLSYWRDFLQDCEDGRSSISLQDLLRFTTGVEESDPSSNLLLLPSNFSSYQAFKNSMEQAIPALTPVEGTVRMHQ
ncbi:hypothetical protein NHX12_019418, partial [Muraenolepis orangiensis]